MPTRSYKSLEAISDNGTLKKKHPKMEFPIIFLEIGTHRLFSSSYTRSNSKRVDNYPLHIGKLAQYRDTRTRPFKNDVLTIEILHTVFIF